MHDPSVSSCLKVRLVSDSDVCDDADTRGVRLRLTAITSAGNTEGSIYCSGTRCFKTWMILVDGQANMT